MATTFELTDVTYLRELAAKMERGFYSVNPQWVRDLADRVEGTLARLAAAHGKVCTPENCVLDGGPEHADFFNGQKPPTTPCRQRPAKSDPMSDELRAAVERIRTQWNRTSKIVDERGNIRFAYIEDLSIVVEAYLAEHSDTPPPDGPPAAAPERKAGERCEGCWTCGAVELVRIQVPNGVLVLCRQCLDAVNSKNPRLRAMEAALRVVCVEAESYIGIGFDHTDESAGLQKAVTAARAALGAGPGGGT